MIKKSALLLLLCFFVFDSIAQEDVTPFQKGLWFTGLDGSISSSSNTLGGNSRGNFNTAYGFNISSSKLFKDRWAGGLILNAARSSSDGILNRQSESIFIGPSIRHFFSEAPQGSLYLEFAPGYVRFYEKSETNLGLTKVFESVDGNGYGMAVKFGYAHVLDKNIVFNFGMNVTNFWIKADRNRQPQNTTQREKLVIGSVAFNFGFSVLLKKFFF